MRQASGRPAARLLTVKEAFNLTPNMIRVIFASPELMGFPLGRAGKSIKQTIPKVDEVKDNFANRLNNGPPPPRLTHTVGKFDKETQELSIDFVAHGDDSPASRWASHVKPDDFLGFAGSSAPKVTQSEADWYLVAADPLAIPVAAAALEAMPRNAKRVAIFEVTLAEDRQKIGIPDGIDVHW